MLGTARRRRDHWPGPDEDISVAGLLKAIPSMESRESLAKAARLARDCQVLNDLKGRGEPGAAATQGTVNETGRLMPCGYEPGLVAPITTA
jgi:hypothetical protein